jgi:L-amino acid N-acyltransferase YncA/DNA-binding transcriptional ArsR family regulator
MPVAPSGPALTGDRPARHVRVAVYRWLTMDCERSSASRALPAPLDRAAASEYAGWFQSLSHPARVQILSVLARGRPLAVGEIVAAVGVGQSTVSQHLKVLAEVGLVLGERRGTARFYRVNEARMHAFPTAASLAEGRMPPVRPAAAAPGSASGHGQDGLARQGGGGTQPGPHAGAPYPQPGPAPPGRLPAGLSIRPMQPADAARVLAIYQAGLDSGQASFETVAPPWEAFDAARLPAHRHVAVGPDGTVLGWVAVSAVSGRCAYAGVVEHSVYVAPEARGRGAGSALLRALIRSTEAAGIWTIQSGVFPENTVSLRVHERAGFRAVGIRKRVGRHHGRWRDVVLIERRSEVAGTG